MNLLWVIVVLLLVLAVIGVPQVGVWHHNYGVVPSGALTLIVVILIILLLSGKL